MKILEIIEELESEIKWLTKDYKKLQEKRKIAYKKNDSDVNKIIIMKEYSKMLGKLSQTIRIKNMLKGIN